MTARSALLALAIVGCAPSTNAPTTTPAPAETDTPSRTDAAEHRGVSRLLSADADFEELVSVIRRLDDIGSGASEDGCIVEARSGGSDSTFRLAADVAPAVHPIPSPPADLDVASTEAAGRARVLSRWGSHGAAGLVLGALTTTPPNAGDALVIVLTDRGAHVLRTNTGPALTPMDPSGDVPIMERLAHATDDISLVLVTAEADVSIARIMDALDAVSRLGSAAALAVALPSSVRLPSEPASEDSEEGLCSAGVLSELAPSETTGALPAECIRAALSELRVEVARCFSTVRGAAARGGRMRVLFRIDDDGRLKESCVAEDEVRDVALRRCVLGSLRTTRFDPPNPPGIVDVALPLRFDADPSLRQRALCD